MRRFEIVDGARRKAKACALLTYNTATREFGIEVFEGVSPDDLPMTLAAHAERGVRRLDPTWSRRWVQERIVPTGRQNLGEVLRAHGLMEYDELTLLVSCEGRCSQDDFYVRELPGAADLPASAEKVGAAQTVGERLARARRERGFTQAELAHRTGVPQPSISAIERGHANPTLDTLQSLARGLELEFYFEFRRPE